MIHTLASFSQILCSSFCHSDKARARRHFRNKVQLAVLLNWF